MKKETLKWLVATVLLVVSISQSCVEGAPQVPCFFIFGDSIVDNGNNNPLPTLAKVNYSPYGIDYPGGEPTGRFTNGKTTVDILAELLGLDPIPSFSTTSTSPKITGGLNYASGGAGIRGETGLLLGKVISLDEQLLRHQITVRRIGSLLKANTSQTLEYMNKCLYSVGMGSNDYINNYYFMPQVYPTSLTYTPEQYAQALIDQYTQQLLNLYSKYGAKKIALVGLGPIGCIPNVISKTNGTACVADMNHAAQLFNEKLVSLVDKLNTNLTDAKFIYVNSMGITESTSVGFKVSNVGCCPVDYISGLCVRSGTPCQNRNEYVFWDAYHPTEAFNQIAASRIYRSFQSTDTYPMDVSHLVQLDLK